MLWPAAQCKGAFVAEVGSLGAFLSVGSISQSITKAGVETKATDIYLTHSILSGVDPSFDSHAVNLNTSESAVTGSVSSQSEPGSAQLQVNLAVNTSAPGPNASSTANTSGSVISNNLLTLDTTTLPAGTPEQFKLTATLTDSVTSTPQSLLTANALMVGVFAQAVNPQIVNELTGLPILSSSNDPASGTFTQILDFQAGQTIELAGVMTFNELFPNSPSGPLSSESINSSLDVTLTPGATFTSALAEADLPEPAALPCVAIIAAMLLMRRRVAKRLGTGKI